ncbi:Cthe_2314 family HEPN domain-containing protein [Paenibacillus sp. y28]|uniref:Cthe_2314 family HEPN domain-containing protein n=1 Tax=Paenibacillus sp. y28 TaxID=3129110 RepID=UPI00301A6A41
MLRSLFGEPPRKDEGLLLEAMQSIKQYDKRLQKLMEKDPKRCHRYTYFSLWALSLIGSLNELEQSVYAAEGYSQKITTTYVEGMSPEELSGYQRYNYYYKNAFIRLFSVLDKLGYFTDELLELNTRKVKERYSYYTVLRQLHHRRSDPDLDRQLFDIKTKYKDTMARLRKQRNMEVHLFNAEMLDDLARANLCRGDRTYVERLDENMRDLQEGLDMVCLSLHTVFTYVVRKGKMIV